MTARQQLLIIDPQNDFCDLPSSWQPTNPLTTQRCAPALPVTGAHSDMLRLAAFIEGHIGVLSDITVTLDSHQRVDIAHPTFWQTGEGDPVAPFTQIGASDVRSGRFLPSNADALPRTLRYLDELEARGRYQLMVWPVHCEIGTWGHAVHAAVQAAVNTWEEALLRQVRHVHKGGNPWTEHYSAMQAEVPDADDPATALNLALLADLDRADTLFIAGEASSHCVRATTEHIVANLPSGQAERIVLLTDCMSPVSGFERQADDFLADMKAKGVRLATAAQASAWLN